MWLAPISAARSFPPAWPFARKFRRVRGVRKRGSLRMLRGQRFQQEPPGSPMVCVKEGKPEPEARARVSLDGGRRRRDSGQRLGGGAWPWVGPARLRCAAQGGCLASGAKTRQHTAWRRHESFMAPSREAQFSSPRGGLACRPARASAPPRQARAGGNERTGGRAPSGCVCVCVNEGSAVSRQRPASAAASSSFFNHPALSIKARRRRQAGGGAAPLGGPAAAQGSRSAAPPPPSRADEERRPWRRRRRRCCSRPGSATPNTAAGKTREVSLSHAPRR